MTPSDAMTVVVEVLNPESPFGGVLVEGVLDRPVQIEFNTGSPVSSVFGRVGDITAQCSDYAACYQPLGEGAGSIGGWAKCTGTALRSGYNTDPATLLQVAETLKALIDDLFTLGLLKP